MCIGGGGGGGAKQPDPTPKVEDQAPDAGPQKPGGPKAPVDSKKLIDGITKTQQSSATGLQIPS